MTGFSIADLIGTKDEAEAGNVTDSITSPSCAVAAAAAASRGDLSPLSLPGLSPPPPPPPAPLRLSGPPDAFGLWQTQVMIPGVFPYSGVPAAHNRAFQPFGAERAHWMQHVVRRMGHALPPCFPGEN